MNWIIFLPPFISIYLIIVSLYFARFALKRSLNNFVQRKDELKEKEILFYYVALTWSAKIGFINSMFMAMVSLVSIWSASNNFKWLVGSGLALFLIFAPMMWWILSQDADELEARILRRLKIRASTFCSLLLIMVNVGLIVVIYINYIISAPAPPQASPPIKP
jgi:hypothetical protein